MEFGDLSEDKNIQVKLLNFRKSVEKISKILEVALNTEVQYEKLSLKDKIDYDLFMAFSLNTLYWLYLRTKGQDPNKNDIKNQLNRVKQYMLKAKEAHERITLRPRLDQAVASRFIKHGIKNQDIGEEPAPKKIKFSDPD